MNLSKPHPLSWERVFALSDIREVADKLLEWSGGVTVCVLEGPMGAGKTTLVRAMCAALGVEDGVNSPTFGLVQQYRTRLGDTVVHIDGFRLEHAGQIDALGIEEVLKGRTPCYIEWPECLIERMEGDYIRLQLVILEGDCRLLKASYVGNE